MKKQTLILSALFIAAFAVGACAKKDSGPTTTTTTITTSSTTSAPSASSIGVPECDDYINKYEKCISSKVPEIARAPMKDAFDKTRAGWKAAASTPEGKQGLAMGCKMAADASKQVVAMYGCEL